MAIVFRSVKAVLLAAMMFFSLRYLGFSVEASAIFSLVSLCLGILSVLSSVAYGLTGIVFILACATALVPDWQTKSKSLLELVNQDKPHPAPKGTTGGQ